MRRSDRGSRRSRPRCGRRRSGGRRRSAWSRAGSARSGRGSARASSRRRRRSPKRTRAAGPATGRSSRKARSEALSVLGGKNSKLKVVGRVWKMSWMCMVVVESHVGLDADLRASRFSGYQIHDRAGSGRPDRQPDRAPAGDGALAGGFGRRDRGGCRGGRDADLGADRSQGAVSHRGRRARQTRRPCWIRRWLRSTHCDRGTICISSRSICSGVFRASSPAAAPAA